MPHFYCILVLCSFLDFSPGSSYGLVVLFKMLLLVLCFRQKGYALVCLYALLLLRLGIYYTFDGFWAPYSALGCPLLLLWFCFGTAVLDVWLLV